MRINLVTSADDKFALPATVMMRSVVDHLVGINKIDFYVLDCGLTFRSRQKMRRSLPRSWAKLNFMPIGPDQLTGFRVDGHVSVAAYARLFLGEALPGTVERVIYMDGDMLALADVSALWQMDLKGHPMGAVQDPIAGLVGQSAQMMHWQGWDVPEGTPYFNSGLMVFDLARWRRENLLEKAIQVARAHPDRMRWWDQCALNYVICGDFEPIGLEWNVLPHLYYPPNSRDVVYDQESVRASIKNPKLIHFSGGYRPWKGSGRHWLEIEFYKYLYRTAWRNDVYCAPWIGRGNTTLTKAKRMLKKILQGEGGSET